MGRRYEIMNDKVSENETSMNNPGVPLNELEILADKGDVDAYERLHNAYMDFSHEAFLPYALRMANDYNYPKAYFDVYYHLLRSTNDPTTTLSLDSCDVRTQKLAIEYLKLAMEKGDFQAIEEYGNLLYEGKFLPKDTLLGKLMIAKYDSLTSE